MDVIVKILTGPQIGAEATLPNGEYRLGSGDDDDLVLADVAALPAHAVLRIADDGVFVRPAVPGAEVLVDGKAIGAETALSLYQVVTIGGTHLAIGPDGQWERLPTPPEKAIETPPPETAAPPGKPETTADPTPTAPSTQPPEPADGKSDTTNNNGKNAEAPPTRAPAATAQSRSWLLYAAMSGVLLGSGWWLAETFVRTSPQHLMAERTAAALRGIGLDAMYPAPAALRPGRLAVDVTDDGRISLTGVVGTSEEKYDVLRAAAIPERDLADNLRVFANESEQAAAALDKEYPDLSLVPDEDRLVVNLEGVVDTFNDYSRAGRIARAALADDLPLRNHLIVWEEAQSHMEGAGARLGLERFRLRRRDGRVAFEHIGRPSHEQIAQLRRIVRDYYGRTGTALFAAAFEKMEQPPEPPPPPEQLIVLAAAPEPAPEPEPEPPPPPSKPEPKEEPPPKPPVRQQWRVQEIDAGGFTDQAGNRHPVGALIGGYRVVDTWSGGVVLNRAGETHFVKEGRSIVAVEGEPAKTG